VWGYALITGLSASVLRAAAMFSFIVTGRNMSRNPDIYNTLAASAFVLMCFNPSLVYDVGFQLSYVAVLSIVFFHPYIYGVRYFKYWIPDQIWALITVSIAAQIGTLPFLLHYFHQFPTWFLLANLMVIPLVTLILYLSFVVFAIAPVFPYLGVLITKVLDWAGQGMLFSVRFIEHLPKSVLTGLYPSDFSLIITTIFVVLVLLFFIRKSRSALIYALISITILLIFNDISIYTKSTQREVVVFNLQGKTLVALTAGRKTIWLTTDRRNTFASFKYYTLPYEGFRGIKESSLICLSDSFTQNSMTMSLQGNFLNFNGLTLCVLNDRRLNKTDWENFPQTDMIILHGKSFPDYDQVFRYNPSSVIVENGPPIRDDKPETSRLADIDKTRILNTNPGGAVQMRFKSLTGGKRFILSHGYFNSK
jgi:competence protein ComEC